MTSDFGRSVTASYPAVGEIVQRMDGVARSVDGAL